MISADVPDLRASIFTLLRFVPRKFDGEEEWRRSREGTLTRHAFRSASDKRGRSLLFAFSISRFIVRFGRGRRGDIKHTATHLSPTWIPHFLSSMKLRRTQEPPGHCLGHISRPFLFSLICFFVGFVLFCCGCLFVCVFVYLSIYWFIYLFIRFLYLPCV